MGKLIRLDECKYRRFEGQEPSDSLLRKVCRNGDLPTNAFAHADIRNDFFVLSLLVFGLLTMIGFSLSYQNVQG